MSAGVKTYSREFKALRDPQEMTDVESEMAGGPVRHNWLEMNDFTFGLLACQLGELALANARTTRSTAWNSPMPDDFLTITRMNAGGGTVTLDGRTLDLSAGDAYALSAIEEFTCDIPQYQDVSLIAIPRPSLRQLGLAEELLWPKGEIVANDGVVDILFDFFHTFAARTLIGPALPRRAVTSVKETLLGMAAALLEQNSIPQPPLHHVIKSFIDDHLHDPALSVTKVASALHVSRRTLYRSFAEQGQAIASYIRSARLQRVKRDLDATHGTGSIREIAARWGFPSSGHFAKVFYREFGVMPSEYIKTLR